MIIRSRFMSFVAYAVSAMVILLGIAGCRPSAPLLNSTGSGTEESEYSQELFNVAMDNLGRLEQFRSGEMLEVIVERLNQWAATQASPGQWRADPLLDTLPEPLRGLPVLADLESLRFPRHDGTALQQAVWLRDIASWARGEKLDELLRAMSLFDWTVRNIQLDPLDGPSEGYDGAPIGQFPWETLLLGHGDVLDRAWVYIGLLRQEGIEAAMLALPSKTPASPGALRAWAVGVLIDDNVFLFDPVLGLPIPAPKDVHLNSDGQLSMRPATLAEAAANPAVLRRLDLDASTPYPVASTEINDVVALIAASSAELSRRMALVESHLVGDQKLVLTVDATAQGDRFCAIPQISKASLWTRPYVTVAQQLMLAENAEFARKRLVQMAPFHVGADAPLWKGRVLHFKGQFVGENGATHYYQAARPPNKQLDGFAELFYRSMKEAQPGADEATLREAAKQRAAMERPAFVRAKQNASYWLGLLAYEQGTFSAAIDYFVTRTLDASPDGPWTHGARYNLARTYEASGELDKAVSQLAADPLSPAHHGNLLRARWISELREQHSGAKE